MFIQVVFQICCDCKVQPKGCDDLKVGIQRLISDDDLQFDKIVKDKKGEENGIAVISIPYTPVNIPALARPIPLTITLPGPVPYSSERVVPWHYGVDMYYYRVKQDRLSSKEKPEEKDNLNVKNIVGGGRMTQSGRVLSPQTVQDKGKQKVVADAPILDLSPDVTKDIEEIIRYV